MLFAGGLMWILWLALIAGIVLLVVGGANTARFHAAPRAKSALEVLRQRYVRGEIDEQEFERRRRILGP